MAWKGFMEIGWDVTAPSQLAFACSNLAIKTLEQGVKFVQS